MRTSCLAGNWKMNLTPEAGAALVKELAASIGAPEAEVLVFPTALGVPAAVAASQGTPVNVGVQNIHWEGSGAFTGEVSAQMALAAGCTHALVGHSERRTLFGETDEHTSKKLQAALGAGLKVVLCVGETLEEREASQTMPVVDRQVAAGLAGVSAEQLASIMIAYEPVWAIGTGKVATPEQAEEVHAHIRQHVSGSHGEEAAQGLRLLYGGSVKPDNVDGLMACANIDGALVGGASLKADSFSRIVGFQKG